jgi:ArpU family phage transcriptional regulator
MIQSPFSLENHHIEISKRHFSFLEPNEANQLLRINTALRALDSDEQIIIFHKYLGKQTLMDFEIQNLMAISERTYYRKKKRALIKLAIALHFLPFNIKG